MSTTTARTSRFADTIGVIAVVTGLVLGLVPGIANATHVGTHELGDPLDGNDFELDGNIATDNGGHDWDEIADYVGDPANTDVTVGEQVKDGTAKEKNEKNWFTPSLKEPDYQHPDATKAWSFVTGGNADKSDLHRLFVASQLAGEDNSYLWLGASRVSDDGNTQVTVEFNQKDAGDMTGHYRTANDFYIRFNFPGKPTGKTGVDQVSVALRKWDGADSGAYPGPDVLLTPAEFDYALGGIATDYTGPAPVTDFIEMQIDLEAIIKGIGAGAGCLSFGSVNFRTESSGGLEDGNNPTLKDVAGPYPIDLDTCAEIDVRKTDADGNALEGAEFTVYSGDRVADINNEVDVSAHEVASCTTEEDGTCSFGPLEPVAGTLDDYTIHETVVPPGYAADPDLPETFDVEPNTAKTLTYTDPRIPYTLTVTPDGRNAVGNTHDFTVTLTQGTGEDVLPVGGQEIDLTWSGVGGIGTDAENVVTSSTCVTDSDTGTCSVTVISDDPGGGVLTATWNPDWDEDGTDDGIYQAHVGPAPAGTGTTVDPEAAEDDLDPTIAYSSINASARKTWVGYEATIEASATNLLGDEHPFTVTVYEVDGIVDENDDRLDGDDNVIDGNLADDVVVTVTWSGETAETSPPDGSTIDGDASSATCTTGEDDNTEGTCVVTVDSDTATGTGTASVTGLSGTITGLGEGNDESITLSDLPAFGDGAISATKTWREYRARLDADAVNPVDVPHKFTVTVEYREDGDWQPAGEGFFVDWEVRDSDVGSDDLDASTCDDGKGDDVDGPDGTAADSTCSIWVESGTVGARQVTLTAVRGDLLPGDDPEETDLRYPISADQFPAPTDDDYDEELDPGRDHVAEKTWRSFAATIDAEGHNRVSTDDVDGSHIFWVTVTQPGSTDTPAVPDGTNVSTEITWSEGPASDVVVFNHCEDESYGTGVDHPEQGAIASDTCFIEVDSEMPGTVSVTVTGLEYDFAGDDNDTVTFAQEDQDSETKTWYAYRARIDTDGVNLVHQSHPFTIFAEQTDDGENWDPVPDGTVVTVEETGDTLASTTCTVVEENDDGTCVVTVNSTQPGFTVVSVVSVTANAVDEIDNEIPLATVDNGVLTANTTTDTEGVVGSLSATKTWVAYRAAIETSATNLTGQEHPFTITAEQDSGSGWVPVPDGTVITVTETGNALDATTCTVVSEDPDGTCVVTVDSAGVATTTVTVLSIGADAVDDPTAAATVANQALTAGVTGNLDGTLDAIKDWISIEVEIGDTATNIAGDDHTFGVTVTVQAPGEVADWELDKVYVSTNDGVGGISSQTCDDPADDATTCQVTVSSNDSGSLTVTVDRVDFTYEGAHGTETFSVDFTTENSAVGEGSTQIRTATKTWRAYRATIEPDGLNRVGDAHPFTVTVWSTEDVDDPTTVDVDERIWSPEVGATPTVGRINPGVGVVTGGDCANGTDGNGQCTVIVNSSVSGTGTFEVQSIGIDDPGTTVVETRTLGDTSVAFDNSDTAEKTWAAFRGLITRDSGNYTGESHTFYVDVEYTTDASPSEQDWQQVPIGSDVQITDDNSDPDNMSVSDNCGSTPVQVSGDAELPDHVCTVTVDSSVAGSLTVTLAGVTATIPGGSEDQLSERLTVLFDRDTDDDPLPGLLSDFDTLARTVDDRPIDAADKDTDDYASTKSWAAYQLRLSPESALNLLNGTLDPDPEERHTVTVHLTSDDPDGLAPIAEQKIDLSVADATFVGGGTTTSCTTDGDGVCSVVITRDTAGQASVNATYDAKVGDSDSVEIDGDADFDEPGIQPATKTWTTFRLTVTPDQAVNLVDTPHVFTVTLWESILTADCGDAAVLGFCLVDTDDPISITPADTPGDDLTINTTDCDDGTNAKGQCVVTVTSGSIRAFTLTATYREPYASYDSAQASIDAVFAEYSGSGDKSWIDYDIDVVGDADNLVNNPHTFTVQLSTIVPDGEGGTTSVGIQGAKPQVVITSGPGSIVPDTDTCASVGTVVDEATPEIGTCTVTITSAVAGVTTVDASYVGYARIDGDTIADDPQDDWRIYDTFTSTEDDSGEKQWLDYLLEVTPNAVNAVGDEHDFTATLSIDTGNGFGPAAGEELTWAVDGVGSIVVEATDGASDVGEDLICTTNDGGQCTLSINSQEAGATDVSVSYDAIVGPTERTDTEERTKQWVAIELVKTAVTTDGFSDGDLIADPGGFPFLAFTSSDQGPKTAVFQYEIHNPSNVTLENVVLTDDRLGTIDLADFPACQTLDPGETCIARASEQFDYFDATASLASLITNVGTVTATGGGERVSAFDDATITLVAVQSSILIDLVKDVVAGAGDVQVVDGRPIVNWSEAEYKAGVSKTVRYRFTVTNISNSPIIDVELIDPMISDEPIIAKADGVTLQPDEQIVVEVDHVLTVDEAFPDGPIASKVDNVATVSGANETRDSFSQDTDDASVFSEIVFAVVKEKPLPATGLNGGLLPVSMLLIAVGAAVLWLDRRRTVG